MIRVMALVLGLPLVGYAVFWQVERYWLNHEKLTAETRTLAAVSLNSLHAAEIARENLARIEPFLRHHSTDLDVWMILGANHRILGRWEKAAAAYERALELEPRPEIHLNLGDSRLKLGDFDSALDHYAQSMRFRESYISSVPIEWRLVYERAEELRRRDAISRSR